jgi:predicted NBD/HSP70 family sugar kinase
VSIDGRSPRLLRRINAATTAHLLHERGPLTLSQVVAGTGLSRRTAEAALDSLVHDGLVERREPSPAGRHAGRPARTYRLRHESAACLGIAVRRRSIEAMVTDLAGDTLATSELAVGPSVSGTERLSALTRSASTALQRAHVPRTRLRALGVGSPGIIDRDGTVEMCTTIPRWEGTALRRDLERWSRCPVIVDNDVNLAAQAERWKGAAQDEDDLMWVLTGRQTRAAIVMDGQLRRGADGAAGEIGWLPALPWSTIRDLSSRHTGRRGSGIRRQPPLTGGDHELISALALGLAALVLTVNPRCLVLGGICAGADSTFIDGLVAELGHLCLKVPAVRVSTLGEHSVAVGAVHAAVRTVQRQLFSVGDGSARSDW